MPSASLIMSICHPELSKFSTAATKWGCEHESVARKKYKSVTSHHDAFSLTACGLFIHTEYPFMGASPDGLVNCLCCGKGTCEVKVSIYYKHFNAVMYNLYNYSGYASSFELKQLWLFPHAVSTLPMWWVSFRSSRESQILFRRDRGIIPAEEESCILLPGISMYNYSICSTCIEFQNSSDAIGEYAA